jgi:hypothetical protein
MVIPYEFGTGEVFWSMLWFFMFFIWIWMLVVVFGDIIRSGDLSGWAKAAWTIFIIVLPYLGVLVYLVARGGKMNQRAIEDARARETATRDYIREVAGSNGNAAAEISQLAQLRAQGVLDEAEFQRAKARVLS